MNKFIKFPLVLGIVGTICAGALSVVYEITKEKIAYNANKEAFELLGGLIPGMQSAESIKDDFKEDKLKKAGITDIYEVKKDNSVYAYGYQAEVTGYNPGIKFVVALSATENIILGFDVISHSETNSGSYGGPLLNSSEFAEQFKNLAFDQVGTVDFVAGSTAKVTLDSVKSGVDGVIAFHRFELLGEKDDGISLSTSERQLLGLPEGYVMEDNTEAFKTSLKANVSANKYNKTMESLGLLNYIDIKDSSGSVKGHAYVVEDKYNCEVEHGNRAWQTYKMVVQFDENGENVKVTIVKSTDSIGGIPEENQPSITIDEWIANNFNGKTLSQLKADLENSAIDKLAGASYTSQYYSEKISAIIFANSDAFKN